MRFDALRQGSSAKAKHAQAGIDQRRTTSLAIECNPDLVRKLGADLMEAERGKQANHRFRHYRRDQNQSVMFCDRRLGQPVSAARHTFEGADLNQATERVSMNSGIDDFLPGQRASLASETEYTVGRSNGWHVAKCIHLFISANISPQNAI